MDHINCLVARWAAWLPGSFHGLGIWQRRDFMPRKTLQVPPIYRGPEVCVFATSSTPASQPTKDRRTNRTSPWQSVSKRRVVFPSRYPCTPCHLSLQSQSRHCGYTTI